MPSRRRPGRNIGKVKIPSKAVCARELDAVRRASIPLLVITGGWNPGFEATGDIVAAAVNAQRAIVRSEHHFPQWHGAEFNPVLSAFMQESDARRVQPAGAGSLPA